MVYHGKGSSALDFRITVKRANSWKEIAKRSVEGMVEAGNEIAGRMAVYMMQEAPVYTGALRSTIRVNRYETSRNDVSWSVIVGGKMGYGTDPRRSQRRASGVKQRNRKGMPSTGQVRKFVDYAEYQNQYGRKAGFVDRALSKHRPEYHNLFIKRVDGSIKYSQSSGGVYKYGKEY